MRFVAAAVILLTLPLAAASAEPRERVLLPDYDLSAFNRACEKGLATARSTIQTMEKRTGPGAVLEEWNGLAATIDDFAGLANLLVNVHPDEMLRDAAEACLRQLALLNTTLFQNAALFRRVGAVQPAGVHQAKLKADLLGGFEDSGVALSPARQRRAREIAARLAELDQAFQRNIRDDVTRVLFRPDELEGLPDAWRAAHASDRDSDGNYLLAPGPPSYAPFMRNARDETARRRYFIARENRGGAANLDILREMTALRRELAGLHGLPSFAHYALRRRMAGNPQTVWEFLAQTGRTVSGIEQREIEELRAAKSRETQRPIEATRVEHWDVPYYQERIRRERFAIDQEALRRYFLTDTAVEFVLRVSHLLFGVSFREAAVPRWHSEVRYLDVIDEASGRRISGIYLDLFPRAGKYGGGVAIQARSASRAARRAPLCVLIANLNRDGLTHNQLTVLMHEFGHVLHCALSSVDYVAHAGLNVKIDFVEAPSRMLEEWARREQSLGLLRTICAACPQLSREQIRGLQAAQRYGRGIGYAREWLLAVYDLSLSTAPVSPLAEWQRLEAATPLGHVEGTHFPASFAHITSGMTAGYYGYLWSEALALEMLAPFGPDMFDPQVGRRFRREVLSQGGQEQEMDLVRRFLGREPSNAMFFEDLAKEP